MKKNMLLPLAFLYFIGFSQTGKKTIIVPQPAEIKINKGFKVINDNIRIIYTSLVLKQSAEYLSTEVKKITTQKDWNT